MAATVITNDIFGDRRTGYEPFVVSDVFQTEWMTLGLVSCFLGPYEDGAIFLRLWVNFNDLHAPLLSLPCGCNSRNPVPFTKLESVFACLCLQSWFVCRFPDCWWTDICVDAPFIVFVIVKPFLLL